MEFWEAFVAGFVGAATFGIFTALIDRFWPPDRPVDN
ncbi:hypothetical protein SEA_PHINKY_1 [Microbacterium phage Phinky]|nr:hypothetical protein SEA_PHINKY_1 [Microbacterium phage Phinky]